MVRKNTVEIEEVDSVPENTAILNKDGEVTGLSNTFGKEARQCAEDLGKALKGSGRKLELSIQLYQVYQLWKGEDKTKGTPLFVYEIMGDKTCPKSYGAVGSDERKKVNGNTVHNGVLHMFNKIAKPAIAAQEEREALAEKGVDVKDDKAVMAFKKQHNATTKADNLADAIARFNKLCVAIDRDGIHNESNMRELLYFAGYEKNSGEGVEAALTPNGEKLKAAAISAILAARGKVAVDAVAKATVK
jgi:hypothetical protein